MDRYRLMDKMDILSILQDKSNTLYRDDLDYFITELDTNDYDIDYINKCKKIIDKLKKANVGEETIEVYDDAQSKIVKTYVGVLSKGQLKEQNMDLIADQFKKDMELIRNNRDYKKLFKKYSKNKDVVCEKLIDENFNFFNEYEISVLLKSNQFSENFLEKYFNVLPHDLIAKTQKFSESFFMKHFINLDTRLVLQNGINDWKDNRSEQLETFLRLKGVRI